MLYQFLRSIAHTALRWYYAEVVVQGGERVPESGPLIIAANHPNALVDALVLGTTLPRRVLLTARATLFEHPVLAHVLRSIGVVPLRRRVDQGAAASFDATRPGSPLDNADAFRAVREALRHQHAVLIFPEGISHDAPALAPLRTGAARMAFDARADGVRHIRLLPVGLIYERKERLRSRVLVRIGEAIELDRWCEGRDPVDPVQLTAALNDRLRLVTLNFASTSGAERAVTMASALAALVAVPPRLDHPPPLAAEVDLARRIESATQSLTEASPALVEQADRFVARVETLRHRLAMRGAALADVRISPRLRHGAWFLVREGTIALLAVPLAVLGRVGHWPPLRLARSLALRPMAVDPSLDQPAMRTILLGCLFVPAWYAALGALVAHWFGAIAAALWLVLLFLSARIDYLLRDRLLRARQRARAYLAFRRDPAIQLETLTEIDTILAEASALEAALLEARDVEEAGGA